ncbi:MAG: hypothetical protein JSS27_08710 [Planctomycetes bacterium]|nr:hypothetical protein [Planctomycetota bacterium]
MGPTSLFHQSRPLLIAHRGNSCAAPENTLPAFLSAVELGVDLVEFDVQAASDGTPIVIHDDTVARTTDAKALWGNDRLKVADLNVAELHSLDAGAWFHARFANTRLSTLDEAIAALVPQTCLMIERKSGTPEQIVGVLNRRQAGDYVTVQAFDWEFLAACHALSPNLQLGALGEGELTNALCQRAVQIGAAIVGWEAPRLTPASIALAHSMKLKVWAWTVDDPDLATRLLAAGIDGLITNRPAAMKPFVAVVR